MIHLWNTFCYIERYINQFFTNTRYIGNNYFNDLANRINNFAFSYLQLPWKKDRNSSTEKQVEKEMTFLEKRLKETKKSEFSDYLLQIISLIRQYLNQKGHIDSTFINENDTITFLKNRLRHIEKSLELLSVNLTSWRIDVIENGQESEQKFLKQCKKTCAIERRTLLVSALFLDIKKRSQTEKNKVKTELKNFFNKKITSHLKRQSLSLLITFSQILRIEDNLEITKKKYLSLSAQIKEMRKTLYKQKKIVQKERNKFDFAAKKIVKRSTTAQTETSVMHLLQNRFFSPSAKIFISHLSFLEQDQQMNEKIFNIKILMYISELVKIHDKFIKNLCKITLQRMEDREKEFEIIVNGTMDLMKMWEEYIELVHDHFKKFVCAGTNREVIELFLFFIKEKERIREGLKNLQLAQKERNQMKNVIKAIMISLTKQQSLRVKNRVKEFETRAFITRRGKFVISRSLYEQ